MARGRHRQRSALAPSRQIERMSYKKRERLILGTLGVSLVTGHLFIATVTVQSLRSSDLRPQQTMVSSLDPSPTPDKASPNEAARQSASRR